jgi:hypothetical protein
VWATIALASLARKFSPSPMPMMSPDDDAGLLGADHRNPVRPDDVTKGVTDRRRQGVQTAVLTLVLFVVVAYEMGEHFRVRGGQELVAGLEQPLSDLLVVLDDAVVHDGNPAGPVQMGMGVLIGRRTVRRPACVCDADLTHHRIGEQLPRDALVDLALLLADLQVPVADDRESRAVIPAVLEAAQPLEQDRRCRLPADVSDDSAHLAPASASAFLRCSAVLFVRDRADGRHGLRHHYAPRRSSSW